MGRHSNVAGEKRLIGKGKFSKAIIVFDRLQAYFSAFYQLLLGEFS